MLSSGPFGLIHPGQFVSLGDNFKKFIAYCIFPRAMASVISNRCEVTTSTSDRATGGPQLMCHNENVNGNLEALGELRSAEPDP